MCRTLCWMLKSFMMESTWLTQKVIHWFWTIISHSFFCRFISNSYLCRNCDPHGLKETFLLVIIYHCLIINVTQKVSVMSKPNCTQGFYLKCCNGFGKMSTWIWARVHCHIHTKASFLFVMNSIISPVDSVGNYQIPTLLSCPTEGFS